MIKKALFILLGTLFLFSCASKKKCLAIEVERDILKQKIINLEVERDILKQEIITLEEANKTLRSEINICYSQHNSSDSIYDNKIDKSAEFSGGNEQLYKFLGDNIQYLDPKGYNITGKVYVQFIIEKNGMLTNIEVIRSLSENYDREVIRVLQKMPRWIPGEHEGEKVRVEYTLPITITLR